MTKLFYSPVSRVKPPGSEHSEPEAVLKGHAFPWHRAHVYSFFFFFIIIIIIYSDTQKTNKFKNVFQNYFWL